MIPNQYWIFFERHQKNNNNNTSDIVYGLDFLSSSRDGILCELGTKQVGRKEEKIHSDNILKNKIIQESTTTTTKNNERIEENNSLYKSNQVLEEKIRKTRKKRTETRVTKKL